MCAKSIKKKKFSADFYRVAGGRHPAAGNPPAAESFRVADLRNSQQIADGIRVQ
jgi:hypothetical protein